VAHGRCRRISWRHLERRGEWQWHRGINGENGGGIWRRRISRRGEMAKIWRHQRRSKCGMAYQRIWRNESDHLNGNINQWQWRNVGENGASISAMARGVSKMAGMAINENTAKINGAISESAAAHRISYGGMNQAERKCKYAAARQWRRQRNGNGGVKYSQLGVGGISAKYGGWRLALRRLAGGWRKRGHRRKRHLAPRRRLA